MCSDYLCAQVIQHKVHFKKISLDFYSRGKQAGGIIWVRKPNILPSVCTESTRITSQQSVNNCRTSDASTKDSSLRTRQTTLVTAWSKNIITGEQIAKNVK